MSQPSRHTTDSARIVPWQCFILAIAGHPFALLAKLMSMPMGVRAEGFVAQHHKHQFEAIAQFISNYPMF